MGEENTGPRSLSRVDLGLQDAEAVLCGLRAPVSTSRMKLRPQPKPRISMRVVFDCSRIKDNSHGDPRPGHQTRKVGLGRQGQQQ
jgi:hypothetical protein